MSSSRSYSRWLDRQSPLNHLVTYMRNILNECLQNLASQFMRRLLAVRRKTLYAHWGALAPCAKP